MATYSSICNLHPSLLLGSLLLLRPRELSLMEVEKKTKHVPVFGYWNSCEETLVFEEETTRREHPWSLSHSRKARRDVEVAEKTHDTTTSMRSKVAKAVDEDLYKIPPELLYQRCSRKRFMGGFWLGCLGLNCIQ